MAALNIPDVTILSAAVTVAGDFQPPGAGSGLSDLAAFCRVVAIATPTTDSLIHLEIWAPEKNWNGKLLALGNNGFNGAISYEAMAGGLRLGYATASSDAGHTGGELTFANGHPEKIADWAWRANHVTLKTAKLVVRNLLGRLPRYSYFQGCDTGGHQALMQAQRFPLDYDGIIAGNPAANRSNEIIAYLRIWLDTHDAHGAEILPAPKLTTLYKASIAACDNNDGVPDGVIDDPRTCRFDPSDLLCDGLETNACLTPVQVKAAKAVYADTTNPRTKERIFSGWPPGSEAFGESGGGSWRSLVNGPTPRRVEFFRYFAFHDPAWNYRTFDFDRDTEYVHSVAGQIDATDPDLAAFAARGGKLIMYTGWADPILPGAEAIHYFDAVSKAMGGSAATSRFMRLYMVPGMGHCRGGPGPSSFDMLTALESWVEQKRPPQEIHATHFDNGVATRTRLLCPYPQAGRWSGTGDANKAEFYDCVMPRQKRAAK